MSSSSSTLGVTVVAVLLVAGESVFVSRIGDDGTLNASAGGELVDLRCASKGPACEEGAAISSSSFTDSVRIASSSPWGSVT